MKWARPRPGGLTASRPMSARIFREQLDLLATEYGLLEEESCQLRARLSEEPAASEHSTSMLPTQLPVDLDLEIQDPRRWLTQDGIHSALPIEQTEEGIEVERLEVPTGFSGTFAVPPPDEKPPSVNLTSPTEHPPSMRMARENVDTNPAATDQALPTWTTQASMTFPWTTQATTTFYGKIKTAATGQSYTDKIQKRTRGPIFANAEDMKDRVRAQLTKQPYNVTDYYKRQGIAQFIARSSVFETLTVLVISLNAVWIWIDTDFNKQEFLTEAHPIFQVAENLFCFYFFIEISIRLCSFENKWTGLKDAWFVFDSFLVFIMILDTWVMAIVILALSSQGQSETSLGDTSILRVTRLLRLMRMARVARLLRAMPELVILIKGLVAAARAVFFTLMLLIVIMYVCAIGLTQMLRNTDPGEIFFDSVPESMHTLWVRATLLDEIWEVMELVGKESVGYVVILDLFILLAALTVMNMLVGVLCEVVSAVAASEREEMNLKYVKSKIQTIFFELGQEEDLNHKISKDEFVKLLDNQEACRVIQELGVDVVGLVDFAEVFFSADDTDQLYSKELSFSEFMEAVVSLRGSNFATVKDIIDLRKMIMDSIGKREDYAREPSTSVRRSHGIEPICHMNSCPRETESTSSSNFLSVQRLHPGAQGNFRSSNASVGSVDPVSSLAIPDVHRDLKLRSAGTSSVGSLSQAFSLNTPSIEDLPEKPGDASGQGGRQFSKPMAWDSGHA